MMRRFVVLVGVLLLLLATACGGPVREERAWTVMGTHAGATVHHRTEDGAEELLAAIRTAFEDVDLAMSSWKPESELNIVNREAALAPFPVENAELYRCIKIALEYAKSTGGAFDPTVGPLIDLWGFRTDSPRVPAPDRVAETLRHVGWEKVEVIKVARAVRFRDRAVRLDLGGIAKGYALDVAARAFAQSGTVAGLLDLGGGMYAWNSPPDSDGWRVGIRDPEDPDAIMATLTIANRAVATSGNYENAFTEAGESFGHILDASTGYQPRSDVVSATVVADAGVDADALSTAIYVAGSGRAAEILEKGRRVEAVLLIDGRSGLEILASASLKNQLELDPGFAARTGARIRFLLPPRSIENQGIVTRFGEK
jgi:thiamine biosynthesis lipoprotein